MNERRYQFDESCERVAFEDDLPDDMTDADYSAWFALSWVDGVRMGPEAERITVSESGESRG